MHHTAYSKETTPNRECVRIPGLALLLYQRRVSLGIAVGIDVYRSLSPGAPNYEPGNDEHPSEQEWNATRFGFRKEGREPLSVLIQECLPLARILDLLKIRTQADVPVSSAISLRLGMI
ncbi:MAG: hypothetical protein JNK48_32525 [Bryobacterales bacterium]|nr:hypothetical protein [Bryobacterales bacterium]